MISFITAENFIHLNKKFLNTPPLKKKNGNPDFATEVYLQNRIYIMKNNI